MLCTQLSGSVSEETRVIIRDVLSMQHSSSSHTGLETESLEQPERGSPKSRSRAGSSETSNSRSHHQVTQQLKPQPLLSGDVRCYDARTSFGTVIADEQGMMDMKAYVRAGQAAKKAQQALFSDLRK